MSEKTKMQKKKANSSEKLSGTLGEAFNFTQDDLEANRAGLMTQRQKQRQWKAVEGIVIGALLVLVFWGFVFFFGLQRTGDDPERIGRVLLVAVITMGLIGYFILRDVPSMFDDIRSGRVEMILEHVRSEKRDISKSGKRTMLIVNKKEFMLSSELDDYHWKTDSAYQIYWLPKSKVILSIEEAVAAEDKTHE